MVSIKPEFLAPGIVDVSCSMSFLREEGGGVNLGALLFLTSLGSVWNSRFFSLDFFRWKNVWGLDDAVGGL